VNGKPDTHDQRRQPELVPESADTITAGFAIRGSGLFDGVRASVDYYDIDVDNVIGSLTRRSS